MKLAYALLAVLALFALPSRQLSVRISDIETETVSWRREIQKIYSRTYFDSYTRQQFLTYYKSSCTGEEKFHHLNCVRDAAAKRGLASGLPSSAPLKDVCCFFWDTFECSPIMECKPLWKEMYEFYIKDRLGQHCSEVPRNSMHCELKDDTKVIRPRYDDMPMPRRPLFYGVKQNWINFIRTITTANKL